jgi:hypothetical protein
MHVKRQPNERGASLVEAALLIPLLIVLLVGVIDLGRAYVAYITIINAAREGAHYGVLHPTGDVCGIAVAEAKDLTAFGMTPVCDPPPECIGGCVAGNPIEVSMLVDFPTILGSIVGIPSIPIRYTVTFQIRDVVAP